MNLQQQLTRGDFTALEFLLSFPTNYFVITGEQLCLELKKEGMVHLAALTQVLSVFSGGGQGREREHQDKVDVNDP